MKINNVNTGLYTAPKATVTQHTQKEKDNFIKGNNSDDLQIYKPVIPENKKPQEASSDMSEGISVSAALFPSPSGEALKTIDIIYTNDIHGAISPSIDSKNPGTLTGGVSYIGSLIKKLKDENQGKNILLDGGDWALGTYESRLTGGKVLIDVMNNLGYDAAEIGNHEFDWGKEPLKDMLAEADFPVLGANILEDGKLMEGVKPYIIKEVNGLKIGIIGVITPETPETLDPKCIVGMKFENARDTVEKYLPEVRKNGADLLVVLSHLGDKEDEKLAETIQGIDVIVGGHSHTFMEEGKKINNTIIVQSGTGGKKVGELKLNIDGATKKIVSFKNNLIPVNNSNLKPDSEIENIISPVMEIAKRNMSEVIGETQVDLTHDRKKVLETVMGNVVTDALRISAVSDIAFENSGGIRDQIMKGKMIFGDLYKVLPFDSTTVAIMDLTGKEIKEILEYSAKKVKDNLQVSGITMDIDPQKPEGNKVSNIKVQGIALEDNKIYKVATDDFIATGVDYATFKEGKNLSYGEPTIEAFKSYIKKHSPLTEEFAKIEGRINYLNPPKENN